MKEVVRMKSENTASPEPPRRELLSPVGRSIELNAPTWWDDIDGGLAIDLVEVMSQRLEAPQCKGRPQRFCAFSWIQYFLSTRA